MIVLKNSDASKVLYLYHSNGFDSLGNVVSQLAFNTNHSDLGIMEGKGWLRYDITASTDKVKLNGKVLKSDYGYKTKYASTGILLKQPSEAWLKEESAFSVGYSSWKTKTKYSNIVGNNNKKYYCLEVVFYKNNLYQYTLYFGQGVGLLRYKDKSGQVFNNSLYYENIAAKFGKSYSSTEALRKEFFEVYKRAMSAGKDTIEIYKINSNRHKVFTYYLDSLITMSMALRNKNSSLTSYSKYLITGILSSEMARLSIVKPRSEGINQFLEYYANWSLYLAPKLSSLSSSYAKKYLKNPNSSWRENYLRSLESVGLARFGLLKTRKYSKADAWDIIGLGQQFLRTGLSKDASMNENNYNFLAYAYYKIGNANYDYYYNVLAAEQFLKMTDKEKALNISYVESTTKDLMRKSTTDEKQYIKGLQVISLYKIKGNALKKAREGYQDKGFKSLAYMFTYGDIALNDSSKSNVGIVVDQLESMGLEYTMDQKRKLLAYYSFLGMKEKANKLKKEINKKEKKKIATKKRSSRGGGFPFGLAVSTNPANLIWNTFPLAADLRIGGTIHQFRVNTHTDRVNSNMFGNYGITESLDENVRKEWSIVKGRDYSYSLLFSAPDNIVIGAQFGYGSLKLSPENAQVRRESNSSVFNVSLDPTITRYSGAMQWGWRFSSRKKHYFFGAYYLLGVGYRTIDYGYTGSLDINNKDEFSFQENKASLGYRHSNWNKFYGIFNYRIRVGITLF